MADIRIETSHGLAVLYAESERAEEWLEEEYGECSGLDNSWPLEEEYLEDCIANAEADGLEVERG